MNVKRYWDDVREFFESPLGAQIKYYALFYFVLWSLHLIFISLISFFHLLLGHNIRTIGDWIGDRGWLLIIISKLLISYLALQFILLKSRKMTSLKNYLRNSMQIPRKEVIVALIFLLIGLTGLGRLSPNKEMIFELPRILFSAVGTFIFFGMDYALIIILEIFFPLHHERERKQKLFLFPLLFYSFTYSTFIYEQIVSIKLYAFFFLLMYVGEWRRRNWTLPLLFLASFLVPSYTLFGLDPVWNANFTFFSMEKTISTISVFILIFFAVGYLHYSEKKKPEYIYRD